MHLSSVMKTNCMLAKSVFINGSLYERVMRTIAIFKKYKKIRNSRRYWDTCNFSALSAFNKKIIKYSFVSTEMLSNNIAPTLGKRAHF